MPNFTIVSDLRPTGDQPPAMKLRGLLGLGAHRPDPIDTCHAPVEAACETAPPRRGLPRRGGFAWEQGGQTSASSPSQRQTYRPQQGNVVSAKAVSGHPLLKKPAVQAALQAKFSPTILSGEAVSVNGTIKYNFLSP